jgi:uncharacterized membrane protein YkvA (DUF1232 family)
MGALSKLKEVSDRIRRDAMTVYFAARDPRTPFLVRVLAFTIAAYALSPIDLIPDFIPVLGYLDDLVLLPLGVILVIKLTPAVVVSESRALANERAEKSSSYIGAAVIVAIWLLGAVGLSYWLWGARSSIAP